MTYLSGFPLICLTVLRTIAGDANGERLSEIPTRNPLASPLTLTDPRFIRFHSLFDSSLAVVVLRVYRTVMMVPAGSTGFTD
ncbi:hypothetical protein JW848_06620, partial [Candidatus Bipolaricaulota bacterium]|nr:hypothetical protein [Candidatus Bipolaricaulota bacterium]